MKVEITRNGGLKKAIRQTTKINSKSINVGVFPESGELEMIARVHEFGCTINVTPKMRKYLHGKGLHLKRAAGTIRIPERSFIRAGYREHKRKFVAHTKTMIVKAMNEKVNVDLVLDRLGTELEGNIQDYAVELRRPENHPFTIQSKGSDNPLVDTGRMIDAITHKVE